MSNLFKLAIVVILGIICFGFVMSLLKTALGIAILLVKLGLILLAVVFVVGWVRRRAMRV